MTQPTIYFDDQQQADLFMYELTGQISDGMWENSKPYDHWQLPCRAEVKVADETNKPGATVRFKRKYDFNNKLLVEVVGDRMRNIVALSKAGYTGQDIRDFDEVYDVMWNSDVDNKYWVEKRARFESVFGTKENWDKIMQDNRPELKDLRKMLKRMSDIVNAGGRS